MLLWGVVLTLMAASLGWAQNNNSVVEAHAVMATDAAHANSPVKLAVLAQVAAGYHINDHKPTLDYLIPTELKVDPSDQFTVKNVVYPKGTPKRFAFSDVPLSVYEGTVVVGALLQAGKAVPAGTYTLKAKFAYQACNDHACLPPSQCAADRDHKSCASQRAVETGGIRCLPTNQIRIVLRHPQAPEGKAPQFRRTGGAESDLAGGIGVGHGSSPREICAGPPSARAGGLSPDRARLSSPRTPRKFPASI